MHFFATRYFVVQSDYTLFPLPDNLKPQDLFILPFVAQKEIMYYNKKYTTRLINSNTSERYLILICISIFHSYVWKLCLHHNFYLFDIQNILFWLIAYTHHYYNIFLQRFLLITCWKNLKVKELTSFLHIVL